MAMESFDVIVIGGGPAGLAAALKADADGANVLLVEREARLGGILKQCIHDGFGLLRFGQKLSGPEYAYRFIEKLPESGITVSTLTFVTRLTKVAHGVEVTLVSREGVKTVLGKKLILSTGCRERTSRQIGVHGRHAAGIFTAGTAQHYTNLLGYLPTKRCVILGSGDIGLIMARRLTLEGAKVLGVYEAKPTPSGLTRNISQCLRDFDIPLYLSKTITRVFGEGRLSQVEVSDVDQRMKPIPGTEQCIDCDALILSVGLIPENELAESLHIPIDNATKGPIVDQRLETMLDGVYACGNALTVFDLVDYVSESGETAGRTERSSPASSRKLIPVETAGDILSIIPQRIDLNDLTRPVDFFFRSAQERGGTKLTVSAGGKVLLEKQYRHLRPPEMEKLTVDLGILAAERPNQLNVALTEVD